MQPHCFDPIPVSASVVVLCDLRVLVKWSKAPGLDTNFPHFPYFYFMGANDRDVGKDRESFPTYCRSIEGLAEFFVDGIIVDGLTHGLNFLTVDVRSTWGRTNPDDSYSIDVGLMTIYDAPDLPYLVDGYSWELVNLDENKFPFGFPYELGSDHHDLWESSRNMFDIMR